MNPLDFTRAFVKFVLFNREKETIRSTGPGLFITKDRISKHGGNVRAGSKEDEWINFIFILPVSEREKGMGADPRVGSVV